MDSLRGHILIASPHLSDPSFGQTVVLLVEHHSEGALGLILNRPTEMQLAKVWHHIDSNPCPRPIRLSYGGPVEGHLMCLHDCSYCSEGDVIDGVFLASKPDVIRQVLLSEDSKCRVFCGYSGWGAGQLESELEVGGWLFGQADHRVVFDTDNEEIWKQSVMRSGELILRESLNLSRFPNNPESN